MRGLNKTFYHQTVNAAQVINYISKEAGFNYGKVFQQYLTTTQIPALEFYFDKTNNKKLYYRYTNCMNGFNLPLVLKKGSEKLKLIPSSMYKSVILKAGQSEVINPADIQRMYYIGVLAK